MRFNFKHYLALAICLCIVNPLMGGDSDQTLSEDQQYDRLCILEDPELEPFEDFAQQASENPNWLYGNTLDTLDDMSLHLDEVFVGMPRLFLKQGEFFQVQLEKVGTNWKDFSGKSDLVIYFTHESYLPEDTQTVLGYLNGKRQMFTEEQLGLYPTLALAVKEVDFAQAYGLDPGQFEHKETEITRISDFGEETFTIQPLGSALPDLVPALHLSPERQEFAMSHASANFCVSAPTSCSGGRPSCSNSYFFLTKVKIKKDHEGMFKGNPEIDLFIGNSDPDQGYSSSSEITTKYIFSGRYVNDEAGNSVYLPDINNKNTWYTINGGAALFPTDLGDVWPLLLVEDDSGAGVLREDANKRNDVRVFIFEASYSIASLLIGSTKYLKVLKKVVTWLWDPGDDLFQDSIGPSNDLFCNESISSGSPNTLHLTSDEWEIQGYVGCVDYSCTPLSLSLSQVGSSITASASGGDAPYTFSWSNVDFTTSSSGANPNYAEKFTSGVATCTVTSADGQSVTRSVYIDPIGCAIICE